MSTIKSNNTGGLVQEFDHTFLPSISAKISLGLAALAMLPCLIKLFLMKYDMGKDK